MQKYLFKVGPVSLADGNLLSEIVDFFEGGAASGKDVMTLIGPDVAAFCDGLIGDSPASARSRSAGSLDDTGETRPATAGDQSISGPAVGLFPLQFRRNSPPPPPQRPDRPGPI